jgi:hypothetical protein
VTLYYQITVAAMKAIICEEYVAMHFLHADSKQYGNLIANVQNDCVSNINKYTKTLSKAYDMLVNYISPAKITVSNDQDGRMSFYQEDTCSHFCYHMKYDNVSAPRIMT